MEVAIVGAGHGGCAAAAHLTLKGARVRLYSRSPDRIEKITDLGGLYTVGVLGEHFVRIPVITTHLDEAVKGADVIMIVVPRNHNHVYATQLIPYLEEGQVIFLNPGSGTALLYAKLVPEEIKRLRLVICETNTLTYQTRMVDEATIGVFNVRKTNLFASFPGCEIDRASSVVEQLYSLKPCKTVLETCLNNNNAVLHPPGVLFNVGRIEDPTHPFLFYYEGYSPGAARVVEQLDREKQNTLRAFGYEDASFLDVFYSGGATSENAYTSGSVYYALKESEPNRTIVSPTTLDHRFMHEDIGFGLVPLASLARVVNQDNSISEALVHLASGIMGVDYWGIGLNLTRMGLEDLSTNGVLEYAMYGKRQ